MLTIHAADEVRTGRDAEPLKDGAVAVDGNRIVSVSLGLRGRNREWRATVPSIGNGWNHADGGPSRSHDDDDEQQHRFERKWDDDDN